MPLTLREAKGGFQEEEIVLSGEIGVEFEEEEVYLKANGIVLWRETSRDGINRGIGPCAGAFL